MWHPLGVPLALALLCGASPAQEREEIGTHGATIGLDRNWRRSRFIDHMGDDQFIGRRDRRGLFAVVQELELLLENEVDFERTLDGFAEWLEVGADAILELGEMSFEREDGLARALRTHTASVSGVTLEYSTGLVARDGLAYHVMPWSPRQRAEAVAAAGGELLRSLEFPDRTTPWGRSVEPRSARLDLRMVYQGPPEAKARLRSDGGSVESRAC